MIVESSAAHPCHCDPDHHHRLLFVASGLDMYRDYHMYLTGEPYIAKRTVLHKQNCVHTDVFLRLVTHVPAAPYIDPQTNQKWSITEKNPHVNKARGYGKCAKCSVYDAAIYNATNADRREQAFRQNHMGT